MIAGKYFTYFPSGAHPVAEQRIQWRQGLTNTFDTVLHQLSQCQRVWNNANFDPVWNRRQRTLHTYGMKKPIKEHGVDNDAHVRVIERHIHVLRGLGRGWFTCTHSCDSAV